MTAYAKAAIGLVLLALGFGGGWLSNGWRMSEKIAEMNSERSDEISIQAKTALDELKEASAAIKGQAQNAALDNSSLLTTMVLVRKDLKNVQAKAPLAADCRPDAARLQSLGAAVDAINKATARPVPSK